MSTYLKPFVDSINELLEKGEMDRPSLSSFFSMHTGYQSFYAQILYRVCMVYSSID